MDPMTIMLIAGALGLNKSEEQAQNYKTNEGIEAQKSRFATFTGQHGQTLARPSSSDPMMQSLMAGAMISQNMPQGQQAGATTTMGNQATSGMLGDSMAAPGAVHSPGMQPPLGANPYGFQNYQQPQFGVS